MTTALSATPPQATAASVTGPVALHSRRLRSALRHYPLAAIAAVYLLILIGCAAAAGLVAPDNPQTQDLAHVLAAPSQAHWLGTDRLGRDVLSRLLFGARVSLLDVAVAAGVFMVLGIPLGVLAGYRGGWLDRVAVRIADLLLAVPAIVVLLMVVAIFPGNDVATMTALGVIGCPGLLRIVRGSTLAIRGELYVEAARLSGLRTPAILRRHILPRIVGPIIVQITLFCATALLAESGLSFLGLSRPEPLGPSWGNMVAEASEAMSQDGWLLIPAGGILMLTVMAFGLIGDAVRDATIGRSAQAPALGRHLRPAGSSPATASPAAPAAPAALLEVDGLTVSLPGPQGPVTVLRDVSLSIEAGEALGIVGESGCGKSITGTTILGLLPAGGIVRAGSVRFNGTELTTADERALTRVRGSGIALISQDPVGSLDPTFTVGSQLREIIRRHHEQSRRDAQREAERLLRMVNLSEPARVLRLRARELSGGMAQRVCIAMALATKPALLIADEPTTALDVTVQAEILALLRDLRRSLGMAVLLISHDWGVLADLCDHAMVMYAGEVVETAPIEVLYRSPRHPYTRALLAANPANPAAVAADGELPAIPGTVPRPGSWPSGCHFQPRCPIAQPDCSHDAIPLATPEAGRSSRCIHIDELDRP
jgi:oligopeptide/dipeptide ABC transporter ATP-binding protein